MHARFARKGKNLNKNLIWIHLPSINADPGTVTVENTTKKNISSPCEYSRCLLRQAGPEAGPPPRQAASAQLPAARRSPGTPESIS
jgi:hypothetical protein